MIRSIKRGRLRWFEHVQHKDDADWLKRCMNMECEGTRQRGRPSKTWWDCVKADMESRDVKLSSNFRSSNYMFEFEFVFQPFDIRFQASLNRPGLFGLQSVALCSHSELLRLAVRCDFFVLCRIVNTSDAAGLITSPLPSCLLSRRSIILLCLQLCFPSANLFLAPVM